MAETKHRYSIPEKKHSFSYYLRNRNRLFKKLSELYYERFYFKYIGYYGHKILSTKHNFTLDGSTYKYFIHQFNQTYYNERCVEIPIIMDALKKYEKKAVLEVGNVLSHYFKCNHTIVDKFEQVEGIINEDIANYRSEDKYDLIISISTIEHIGWDDETKDEAKIPIVMSHLRSLLNTNGTILITAPLGYNPYLDKMIELKQLGLSKYLFLKRRSKRNEWIELKEHDINNAHYGYPYPNANFLFVGVYKN
jgi:hypothetical protein